MPHGWRARIHVLTRKRSFLLRSSLAILAGGFATACLIQWLRTAGQPAPVQTMLIDPVMQSIRESYRKLDTAAQQDPRALARWLTNVFQFERRLCSALEDEEPPLEAFLKSSRLFGFEARKLIDKHAAAGAQRQVFSDSILARLDKTGDKGKAALERIRQVTASSPAVPCANQLLASVLLAKDQKPEALAALIREGALDDAGEARNAALLLAVELRDVEQLRILMRKPGWIESAPPLLQHTIGALTGDVWMQWKGLLVHQFANTRYSLLLLTMFTTGLWYVIFVQRSDNERWRWARPLLPLMAGVCSVWPTLAILTYQEHHLGMTADAPFPHDLWYFLAGVGLREELSKLAAFALFLPWLLWRRKPGAAVLIGAFIGLGFGLEENVGYYEEGGGVAWARFITANFMHASMTAILANSLYEMLRARFGHAERFLITFVMIIAAHGFYDYAIVSGFDEGMGGGLGLLPIIILALLANRLFDLLAEQTRPDTGSVSPAAVFLIGSSLLIAALFIAAGIQTDDIAGIAAVGVECVGIAPVALVYWRKFDVAR